MPKSDFGCNMLAKLVLIFLVFLFGVGPVSAATLVRFDHQAVLQAREQPVAEFLEELFGQIGVPVMVDERITGTVNGGFADSLEEIYADIASSFQLAMYYDGAIVHIYPARDINRRMLYVSPAVAKRVLASERSMQMQDAQNHIESIDVGLIVTGTRRFLEQVEELVNAVKSDTKAYVPADTYRVFRLRYAWADDVTMVVGGQELTVPGVATLLRTLIEPGSLAVPPGVQRSVSPATLDGLRGQGLSSQGQSQDSSIQSGQSRGQTVTAGLRGSTINTRIVADSINNAIVIRDKPARMASYASLIDSLDREPMMVEIEATIIDMDTDRLRDLGINWRLQSGDGDSEALFGNGTASDLALNPGQVVTPSANGGVVSLVLGNRDQFISRINALETQGAARVVSKPHVITLSNVEALLNTSSTFFVRVAGREEVDLFNVSVGTTLRVTPHVFERGARAQIKLLVGIVDGQTSERQVDDIPVLEESSINTQALINEGQSLLIGGLVREFSSNSVSKVPVLGDIPVVGSLFRNNSKTTSRVERLFLITPRLSLQPGVAHRFDVPTLAGSQEDIISSAPSRMTETNAALDIRDRQFPQPNDLPLGSSTAALLREDVAVSPGHPDTLPSIDAPSVRERLRNYQELPLPVTPSEMRGESRDKSRTRSNQQDRKLERIVPKVEPLPVPPQDNGWHEVTVSSSPSAVQLPLPVRPQSAVTADDDPEWQEVIQ